MKSSKLWRQVAGHLAASALLLLGVPTSAGADTSTVGDPRDHGDFHDIKWVRHDHGSDAGVLRHGLSTYDRWGDKFLKDRRIRFDLSLDNDEKPERAVRVRFTDGRLQARMYKGSHLTERVEGRVKVWRPDRRTLMVSFRARMLGRGVLSYEWKGRFYGLVVCSRPCPGDRAPDEGLIRHQL